jgi:uncharacterized protein YukE
MSDHIDVEPEAIMTHAAHIDELRDRFAAIQSAMDSVQQDNEAYGIICQFLPPILAERQEDQKRLSTKAQSNLEKLAQALRETADSYTAADEETAQEYEQLQAGL